MSDNPLSTIMSPESIAMVGASNNPTKMGTFQFLNLIHSGFPGKVFCVHPKEKAVFGVPAYPTISALPHAPDLAMLVVPTHLIPEMIEAFGRLGTRHAIIISAGFKETGKTGIALEQQLGAIAHKYNLRFLGPNCMGILNMQIPLNLTAAPIMDGKGPLGLISQSGTYIAQTRSYLLKRGIRLSKAISVGNEADIDIIDALEFLGADPETRAIGLYVECIRRAAEFLETARRVSRHKPIVAQYVGGTTAGARSGASHTGAVAGPDNIYDGLFAQAGVIRVDSIESVYLTGHTLATQPELKGKRIAILTNSGGPGTAMATTLEGCGLEVPALDAALQTKIGEHLPGHASTGNPVDLTFHTDMDHISNLFPRLLLEADHIDGLLIHGIIDTGWAEMVHPVYEPHLKVTREDLNEMFQIDLNKLVAMPQQYGKPLLISSFFGREDNAVTEFQKHGIPVFDSPEMVARAMAALYQYHKSRTAAGNIVTDVPTAPPAAVQILQDGNTIDEFSAKEILRSYGIPTCREKRVSTLEDAVAAAHTIGYPVVLKSCSAEIQHKTEQGLVHLNLQNDQDVAKAYAALQSKHPAPVLVCEMVKGVREVMAGLTRFPGFPPCILFGLGGIFTEALEDHVVRLAPFEQDEALSQIESLKARRILDAYRGLDSVNQEALASILVQLGNLAVHFPEIKEIDLNPITITAEGTPKVVDALFVR